jgi:serpin B
MSIVRRGPPALVSASNRFGFELQAELARAPGNLVFSPASIATALAMTWLGAAGTTRDEMGEVLHLGDEADAVAREAGELAATISDPRRAVTIAMANRLFGARRYVFEPPFLEEVARIFGAPLEPLDFASDPDAARAHINRWVEEATRGCIRDLLGPGAFSRETRLALVNAVYFLGTWQDPFEVRDTMPRPFHIGGGTPAPVPTMTKTSTYRTARDGAAQIVELRYAGSAALVIAMPDAPDGLSALEAGLDDQRFARWIAALKDERVVLSLPRIELRPAGARSLGAPLAALGMKVPFDPARADFTRMANPPDPADRVVLSQVFHKAFVRMDEKGTEAAAATAIAMPTGGPPKPPRALAIDRPYLFFIVDHRTSWVLFAGRVVDPTHAG